MMDPNKSSKRADKNRGNDYKNWDESGISGSPIIASGTWIQISIGIPERLHKGTH